MNGSGGNLAILVGVVAGIVLAFWAIRRAHLRATAASLVAGPRDVWEVIVLYKSDTMATTAVYRMRFWDWPAKGGPHGLAASVAYDDAKEHAEEIAGCGLWGV